MASEALCLTNVHAFYGDSHILHGVGFSLQAGGVLALLGRNGAGKTTCISTIVGFLRPRDGEIRLYGEPIGGLSPERISRLGIGLVPQGRRIFPSLTVRENLVVAQQRESSTEKPWNVERIYELFPKLRERHAQFAGTLSGGEQQMLAMGRALMARPKVLLMDEPSMGLAPIMVDKIFEVVGDIHSRGTTILLVEQNASRALQLANRGYVMESGEITMSGPSKALLDDPKVRAAYLGE